MNRLIPAIYLMVSIAIVPVQGQWQSRVDQHLSHQDLSSALVAIQVKSLDGKVLYERNPKIGVMPASTIKTVTTLGAIGILGADYKYETVVGYKGERLEDGTLIGDLVVVGSGDPSFGSDQDDSATSLDRRLENIANAISEELSCVDGKLLIDATVFDQEAIHPGWAWDDLCNYYATGVWGVNIHENLYHLSFDRSLTPGARTEVSSVKPSVDGLQLRNEVTVGPVGSYDEAYIYGDPNELKKQIRGTIPPGSSRFKIKGAVPDSRQWFAQLLMDRLQSKGISIDEIEILKKPVGEIKEIVTLYSEELRVLAQHANEVSDNMYCDAFLKTVGVKLNGTGTWKTGQEELKTYFKSSKIDTEGYHQEDGSGLTMRNRVSASFMTDFLLHNIQKLGVEELQYLLPKAGENGSVKNFLNESKAQAHTWLKSGSINAVVAYTGILEVASEEHVVVYIASNGHTKSNRSIRRQIERIIDTIYLGLASNGGK